MMMGMGQPVAKAKSFRPTFTRLLGKLRPEAPRILLVILLLGLLMDYAMGILTDVLCPHSRLELVKR